MEVKLDVKQYVFELLKEDIDTYFNLVFNKSSDFMMYIALNHIVINQEMDDLLNEFNRINNLPQQSGFINPLTRSVLDNCINLSYQIERIERSERFKMPDYVLTNLKLLAYLQVLETKYIFKVFGNTLLILQDQEPIPDLFDNSRSGNDSLQKVMEQYDKVKTEYGNQNCIEKWSNLFYIDLRNAIAHNDYVIDRETKFTSIPKAFADSIVGKNKNNEKFTKISYDKDFIDELHFCSKTFNEAFNDVIDNWFYKLSPFNKT